MFRRITIPILIIIAMAALLATPAAATTLEITGPPGASLNINGQDMGFLPLDGPLELQTGIYLIKSELPGFIAYENELELLADVPWLRLTVRLVPLSRKTAWTSNILLAGLGQHYLGKPTRGYIYSAAEVGGLLVALFAELERTNLRKDYLDLQDKYNSSINADEIVRYREAADQAYSDMKDKEDLRNQGLIVAGSAIVISIIDALVFFPAVEAGAGPVPVDYGALEHGPWSDPNPLTTVHAAVRLEF